MMFNEDARHDPNEGRFRNEFEKVVAIGKGSFATVYSAVCRTDKHPYAVKVIKTHRGDRQALQREVQVLAKLAMGDCSHLVRYFSSWWEDGVLHIQTELGTGSLRSLLDDRAAAGRTDPRLADGELLLLLRHIAAGLKELHAHGYAHLDVKPDNILTTRDGEPSHEVYKLADLGLVTAIDGAKGHDVEEGDARYVARELLNRRSTDLPKTDVFSAGLVIYEAATNPKSLPLNGDEWQELRHGRLDTTKLLDLSPDLLELLFRMVSGDQTKRPTSAELVDIAGRIVFERQGVAPKAGGKGAAVAVAVQTEDPQM